MKSFFIAICLLGYCTLLLAQNNDKPYFADTKAIVGKANLTGTGPIFTFNIARNLPAKPLRERPVSARLLLYLDTGDDHIAFKGETFTATLPLKVDLAGSSQPADLAIDQDKPEQVQVIDLLGYLISGSLANVKVNITSPLDIPPTSGLLVKPHLESNIRLRGRVEIHYAIDVRTEVPGGQTAMADACLATKVGTPSRVHTFEWSSVNNHVFPNYQLELLKLENTDSSYLKKNQEIRTMVDWSQALSVETQSHQTNVTLTIGEGSGFYLWRVRPIGTYFEGESANRQNFGLWSNAPETGDVIVLNKNGISNPAAFYFTDPDEDLNWIYNRIFTEGDANGDGVRVSEGITYADGLLRVRQNQAYNSANGERLVSQTISDYSGRPALSTLPVPLPGNLKEGYEERLVRTKGITGNLYRADYFDLGDLHDPATVKDDGNSAFKYYSDNNPDTRIPNAEGYPYTRTLYKTDGSNRVVEVSGVGKRHALGKQTDGRGRTTRTYFTTATDYELVRMFGDEAPLGKSVIKTISIDPNNVISVSYTSKEGNVIATGLATESTDNLLALQDKPSGMTVKNTLDQNRLDAGKFISSKRLALPTSATVNLAYQLKCTLPFGDCNSADCDYRMQLFLTDLTTGVMYKSNTLSCKDIVSGMNMNLAGLTWTDMAAGAAQNNLGSGSTLNLPGGEYLITKVVSPGFSNDFMNKASDEFEGKTGPIIDAIAEKMSEVNNADDYADFETFLSTLSQLCNGLPGTKAQVITFLGLPAGTDIPDDFRVNYTPNSAGAPADLKFSGGCCDEPAIAIEKPEKCATCDLVKNGADAATIQSSVNTEFIGYLVKQMIAQDVKQLGDLAPGFTFESLEFMLTQMMIAQYHTGQILKDDTDGKWYKAEEDSEGKLAFSTPKEEFTQNNPLVYTDTEEKCKRFFDCWVACVNMIKGFEFEDDLRVMDEFDERQGGGESDSHYDDDENRESGFLNAAMSFIVSEKMQKFNDSDEGKVTKQRQQSTVCLPNMFLDCVGYQFYEVIDERLEGNVNHPKIAEISKDLIAGSAVFIPNYSTFDGGKLDPPPAVYLAPGFQIPWLEEGSSKRLYYPYVLWPHWKWKYFHYNTAFSDDTPNDEEQFIAQMPIEVASCYDLPDCAVNQTDPLCYNPCRYYHINWSASQRLNFYHQIKGAPQDPANIISHNDDPKKPQSCPSADTLKDLAIHKLEVALFNYQNRYSEIRAAIIRELEVACYTIVDCAPSTGQVSLRQVDQMVAAVLEKGRETIVAIKDKIEAGGSGFPKCEEVSCFWVNDAGTCIQEVEYKVQLLAPCDEVLLDQISDWEFVPYFPALQPCTGTQPLYDPGSCDANTGEFPLGKHSAKITVVKQ